MKNLSAQEISELVDQLGPTLVAVGAACTNRSIPSSWLTGDTIPLPGQMQRLSVMKELLEMVAAAEGYDIARTWFTGANCANMTKSPAEVIREGRFREARISAQNKVNDSFS